MSASVYFTEFFLNHPLTMAKITLPFHGLTHARCPAMSVMHLTCYRYKRFFLYLCSKTVLKGHTLQNISKIKNFWIYFFHVLFTGSFEVIRGLICISPKTSQVPKRNLGQLYRAECLCDCPPRINWIMRPETSLHHKSLRIQN